MTHWGWQVLSAVLGLLVVLRLAEWTVQLYHRLVH
jgi:hypothetical protein